VASTLGRAGAARALAASAAGSASEGLLENCVASAPFLFSVSPLFAAAWGGHADVASFLIERALPRPFDSDTEVRTATALSTGLSLCPRGFCFWLSPLGAAARNGHSDVSSLLLRSGALLSRNAQIEEHVCGAVAGGSYILRCARLGPSHLTVPPLLAWRAGEAISSQPPPPPPVIPQVETHAVPAAEEASYGVPESEVDSEPYVELGSGFGAAAAAAEAAAVEERTRAAAGRARLALEALREEGVGEEEDGELRRLEAELAALVDEVGLHPRADGEL